MLAGLKQTLSRKVGSSCSREPYRNLLECLKKLDLPGLASGDGKADMRFRTVLIFKDL